MEKRFSPVTWQHTTVRSSFTTPQWNCVSWIPWQTTEIQRQTVFTKQFTVPGIQNHIKKMTRATAQLFQSVVWRTPHHVHDLDHKKHFGVLFLTWQRQKKKKSFCFFLWEKELYSTRITSRCCSAFQQTRKLSGCFLLTKTLGAFVYYLSITPITFGVTQNRCWWNGICGTSERFSPVEGSRVSQKLTSSRYIVLAQAPKVITIYVFTCNFKEKKKKTWKKFVPCIPPAVSFETHKRTSEQRAGRTRTKRLSLSTASQTSEDSVLVKDWLIDSDIFTVCQFPPVLNMNVGTSFPGSLMQCVRLSIKCVCAPVTSHVIAFVY